ncbi:hypothetical protein [Azospirillum sp. TSO22-1]|nr:hypothetical protein [Azospirillum sp. TSO22-1]
MDKQVNKYHNAFIGVAEPMIEVRSPSSRSLPGHGISGEFG